MEHAVDQKNLIDIKKFVPLRVQTEHMLQNAIQMTEMGMDIKERCIQGEKYVCYLRSLAIRAAKNIKILQNTSNQFLSLAQKVATNAISSIDTSPVLDPHVINIKLEYAKLLSIIEKELADVDDLELVETTTKLSNISEKIRYLETKQKMSDGAYVQQCGSVKSVKSDVDEKYPENWSRDSLIDLNNVVNLPSVPEDIFTSFNNKPTRTSSLSSLKGMRKVKLFLQRAANNSDDEDSSDLEEHDYSKIIVGDSDDKFIGNSKKALGNIKEETQNQDS